MGRARHNQRDLFEQVTAATLPSDLQTKLAVLLKALLTEAAAGAEARQTTLADVGGKEEEDGDDQDHA